MLATKKLTILLIISFIASCSQISTIKTQKNNKKIERHTSSSIPSAKTQALIQNFWDISGKLKDNNKLKKNIFDKIVRQLPPSKLDQLMLNFFSKDVLNTYSSYVIELALNEINNSPKDYYYQTKRSATFKKNALLILKEKQATFKLRESALMTFKNNLQELASFVAPKEKFKKISEEHALNILSFKNQLTLKDMSSQLLSNLINLDVGNDKTKQIEVQNLISKVIKNPQDFNVRMHYVVAKYLRTKAYFEIEKDDTYRNYFIKLLTMSSANRGFNKHQLEAVYYLSSKNNLQYFKALIDFPMDQDSKIQHLISKKISQYFYRFTEISHFENYLKLIMDRGLHISNTNKASSRATVELLKFFIKYDKQAPYDKLIADLRFQRYIRRVAEYGQPKIIKLVLKLLSSIDNVDENMIKNLFYISRTKKFEDQSYDIINKKLNNTSSNYLKNKYMQHANWNNKLSLKDLMIPTYNCDHFISVLFY